MSNVVLIVLTVLMIVWFVGSSYYEAYRRRAILRERKKPENTP